MRLLLGTHVFLWYITADPNPFDRLLVAQALQHGLTVATIDPEIAAYPVPLLPTE
jgi:PIN domain nuclease of toxin-antitoxin system